MPFFVCHYYGSKASTKLVAIQFDQDTQINLTASEASLLLAFANANNKVLDTGVICDILMEKNHELEVTKRAIENIISRLRKKIAEANPAIQNDKIIQSVWNQGYQLCLAITIM
jgi:DNA-binding response OmpR family regulator